MSQIAVRRSDWRRRWARVALGALLVGLFVGLTLSTAATAHACNTPVYRYAMYNWAPAPFIIAYVHYGEPAEQDTELHEMIAELSETGPAMANLVLAPVDLSEGQFDDLPEVVQDAWLAHIRQEAKAAVPAHLVFTPWREKLFVGQLDAATLQAMVDSPARTKIGELLHDGCAAVIVFLPGSDAAENQQAEKVARDVIAQAAAGQIAVESGLLDASLAQWPPPGQAADDADSDAPSDEERMAEFNRLKVGLVKVERSDEAEKWLVGSLVAMEQDLAELAEHPMIFFAYGRGRAMLPYVGKGINEENLTAEIQFLASACSCFVKDQNPGADLLMCWDWEATADAMAANDPSMSGGPFAYEEFYPDETGKMVASVESETAAEVAAMAARTPGAASVSSPQPEAPPSANARPTADAGLAATQELRPSSEPPAMRTPDENPAAVPVAVPEPEANPGGSFAAKQMLIFGIALAVVTVIVLGAGFVLVQRRATVGG